MNLALHTRTVRRSHVRFERRFLAALAGRGLVYALHFGHLIVPLPDVGANQVEDALEWRDKVFGDVVLCIELPVWIDKKVLRGDASVNQPCPWRASDDHVRNSLAVLRLCPSILEHLPRADQSPGRRRALVRVRPQTNFPSKAEVLDRDRPAHDLVALLLKVVLDLAQVSSVKKQLERLLLHLLLSWRAISADCFYAFGVKLRLDLVLALELVPDVAFLCEKQARVVDFLEL